MALKFVTRERIKVDRVACPWLIKRFIDADAELLFVPKDQVLEVAEREGAQQPHAPRRKNVLDPAMHALHLCAPG